MLQNFPSALSPCHCSVGKPKSSGYGCLIELVASIKRTISDVRTPCIEHMWWRFVVMTITINEELGDTVGAQSTTLGLVGEDQTATIVGLRYATSRDHVRVRVKGGLWRPMIDLHFKIVLRAFHHLLGMIGAGVCARLRHNGVSSVKYIELVSPLPLGLNGTMIRCDPIATLLLYTRFPGTIRPCAVAAD